MATGTVLRLCHFFPSTVLRLGRSIFVRAPVASSRRTGPIMAVVWLARTVESGARASSDASIVIAWHVSTACCVCFSSQHVSSPRAIAIALTLAAITEGLSSQPPCRHPAQEIFTWSLWACTKFRMRSTPVQCPSTISPWCRASCSLGLQHMSPGVFQHLPLRGALSIPGRVCFLLVAQIRPCFEPQDPRTPGPQDLRTQDTGHGCCV
jgi:hypothetical protein